MRYTLDFGSPLPPAWRAVPDDTRARYWNAFTDKVGGFRPGVDPATWPAITEPTPSLTFDLADPSPPRGAWSARHDAVNAEALRCFVTEFGDDPIFVVLDWQHPSYLFDAALHAATDDAEWRVPVYPNGDYYAFLRTDLSEGTFGHPWERTLCVFGERLVATLSRTLATWLPIKRMNGESVDGGAERSPDQRSPT